MSLTLVPVPLGNPLDITLHAIEVLKSCDTIIVEETKESTQWLRAHQISKSPYSILNEHTKPSELQDLVDLCEKKNVCLITDCGTPGFCDPGADLVRECRKRKIAVRALPGPSSLMMLLSLASQRLDTFLFVGFLPQETEARKNSYLNLQKEKKAFILMDTPYRFQKSVQELKTYFPERKILLATNLTQPNEWIYEGLAKNYPDNHDLKKAEFLALVYPKLFLV